MALLVRRDLRTNGPARSLAAHCPRTPRPPAVAAADRAASVDRVRWAAPARRWAVSVASAVLEAWAVTADSAALAESVVLEASAESVPPAR